MLPTARLNARLFVRGKNIILGTQGLSLPQPLVEIEDRSRPFQKLWIARENPTSITPRSNGVLTEPAPDGGSADLGHQSLVENMVAEIGDGETRQWQTGAMGELTGESFYLHDETGGKSGPAARLEVHPRGPANGQGRSAYATC